MPKPRTAENILDDNEIKSMISNCKNFEEELVVKGLVFTGMRVSELLHTNKGWIKEGYIRIPKSMPCNCYECKKEIWEINNKTKEKILKKPSGIWMPKTLSSVRSIPLVPETKPIFEEAFKRGDSIRHILNNRVNTWRILKKVEKRARLNKTIFPHCLRGTFACILDNKGFSESEIIDALGWKNNAMFRTYIKTTPQRLMRAFEKKW